MTRPAAWLPGRVENPTALRGLSVAADGQDIDGEVHRGSRGRGGHQQRSAAKAMADGSG
jgi:hypothetical protein